MWLLPYPDTPIVWKRGIWTNRTTFHASNIHKFNLRVLEHITPHFPPIFSRHLMPLCGFGFARYIFFNYLNTVRSEFCYILELAGIYLRLTLSRFHSAAVAAIYDIMLS